MATDCRTGGFALGLLFLAGSAGAGTPFTEEASDRGIVYVTSDLGGFGTSAGVAFADLDGDGDPDIVVVGQADGAVGVYENDGSGMFANRASHSGIPPMTEASGVAAADYDGDGDLDLYISAIGTTNKLLRNEGSFFFTDVTTTAGVGDEGAGHGCAWGDYDGDGWLDLYVANRTEPLYPKQNRLYRNRGDGTFEDVAAALGVQRPGDPTFHATFVDFDLDGTTDLYLCTDKGNPDCALFRNHLFRNVGGTFVEITDSSGTEACVGCMGVGVGDLDRDGELDLYCTNIADGNVLFMNRGDRTFAERADAAGMRSYAIGWANIFFDHDNDGFLDLYVCNSNAPNRLYDCGASWPCTDVGPAMGVATPGASYCFSAADIDDDGDLDLLVQTDSEPIRLYVNHEDGTRAWLKVKLAGKAPNTHAIGAAVVARTGSQTWIREVRSTVGFKSSWPTAVHFGLGDATVVDQLTIVWPDGIRTTTSGVSPDQTLTVDQEGTVVAGAGSVDALTLERSGAGAVDLTWGASCAGADTDFAVYEGPLGDFASHVPVTCTTGGALAWSLVPASGSRYYLVVPRRAEVEGSHGRTSGGDERLRGPAACVAQLATSCP